MLSEMSGAGPVLLALTGNDDGASLGKVNWKKVKTRFKKVAKVGGWVLAPAAMATYTAAKATKDALKRKQAKNIQNLKIERANRARKLALARTLQAKAEQEAKTAQTSNAATPSYFPTSTPAPEYESPMEEVNETADAPADEMEEIQDTSEEGAEENVETMGYSRSNDDYFVGSPLKSTLKKVALKTAAAKSGQLKVVSKVATPNKKLLIVGGLVVGAILFRKQLSRAFK